MLRLRHYFEHAPRANQGAAAAHLTNYALHCITRRVRGSADLRNRSLRSVGNLQSLQLGDRSQYKWGDRQPVRRRRGDVHGDLTAIVLRLDWEGGAPSSLCSVPLFPWLPCCMTAGKKWLWCDCCMLECKEDRIVVHQMRIMLQS